MKRNHMLPSWADPTLPVAEGDAAPQSSICSSIRAIS